MDGTLDNNNNMDGSKGTSFFEDRHYPDEGDAGVGPGSLELDKKKVKVLVDKFAGHEMNFLTLSNRLGKPGIKFGPQAIQCQIDEVDNCIGIVD